MARSCVRSHHSGHRCCGTRHLVRPRRVNPARKGAGQQPCTAYEILGTGPQVAFLKSSPALPDWSLPVPGLRTPMRLTCFPELHPTLQTPSPCTTTFSSLGSASATKPATSGDELAYPRPECAV